MTGLNTSTRPQSPRLLASQEQHLRHSKNSFIESEDDGLEREEKDEVSDSEGEEEEEVQQRVPEHEASVAMRPPSASCASTGSGSSGKISVVMLNTTNCRPASNNSLPDIKSPTTPTSSGKRLNISGSPKSSKDSPGNNLSSISPQATSSRNAGSNKKAKFSFESEEITLKGLSLNETNAATTKIPMSIGLVGLDNLGNTCFMNSSLQVLAHCSIFAQKFLDGGIKPDINHKNDGAKGKLVEAYIDLLTKMYEAKEHCSIKPTQVKRIIGQVAPHFSGYMQHDAQEFLRFFLDALHEDVNRVTQKIPYEEIQDVDDELVSQTGNRWWSHYEKRNDSHVKDCFAGQLYSLVECQTCGNQSRAFDPILDLSVPVPEKGKDIQVQDCLKGLTYPEKLEGDNSYYCRKCKSHQPSTRTIKIYRTPEILVIHLKRFSHVRKSKISTKIHLPVDEELDLSEFCHDNIKPKYKLFGTVNHMGGLTGGHYTAHAKNPADNQWYNFNDSRVSKVDPRNFDTSAAYLLFFERVNIINDEKKKANL